LVRNLILIVLAVAHAVNAVGFTVLAVYLLDY